jgi:6,7-dimethyl-8-ribityllumazine synthase
VILTLVHTRWNKSIVQSLVEGCVQTLKEHHVLSQNITLVEVSGSYELPLASQTLLETKEYDACISIGVLIKGSTLHFEYIADAVSQGLMQVGLKTRKPVIFGVLTCLNEDQAKARAGLPNATGQMHNHGHDWAQAALEMARLVQNANQGKSSA